MQNPSDLYRFENDQPELAPEPGVLIVALGGFIDAGHTGEVLADHLLATGEPELVASFDVDQLLDYRGRRPAMVFESNHWESYDEPSLVLQRLRDRDGQGYYLLTGPEPDYQWERVVAAVREIIDVLGVTLTVHAHGIPMAVPHTRPLGMTAHANAETLLGERNPVFGTIQVPAGLTALLELRLGQHDQPAAGFAVHVPHYLAQAEFHDAALTALAAITDLTALNLPNDDLVQAAGANRAEIAREVEANPEVGEAVTALERQYDAYIEGEKRKSLLASEPSEIPSADELGAEFEQFLRTVDEDGPSA